MTRLVGTRMNDSVRALPWQRSASNPYASIHTCRSTVQGCVYPIREGAADGQHDNTSHREAPSLSCVDLHHAGQTG